MPWLAGAYFAAIAAERTHMKYKLIKAEKLIPGTKEMLIANQLSRPKTQKQIAMGIARTLINGPLGPDLNLLWLGPLKDTLRTMRRKGYIIELRK